MAKTTKIRLQIVSPTKYDWRNISKLITQGCYTPYDKAKAIYCWLIDNISYDTNYKIHDADTAWMKKKGVCQAYCELFYRLGKAADIDVRIITGHGRGSANTSKVIEDHCWIVVNKNLYSSYEYPEVIIYEEGHEEDANISITEGLSSRNAIFIEPTWGAGVVENGKFIKSNHDMSWFDVNPCWMIFTHYPKNINDQLLGQYALSTNDYKQLPYLHPSFEDYGFDSTDLMSYFIHKGSCDFPKIYPNYGMFVEFVNIPIGSNLAYNKTYRFDILKKKKCNIAIINSNDFYIDDDGKDSWTHSTNVWSITLAPKRKGKLTLSIRDENNSNLYNSIIEYNIK